MRQERLILWDLVGRRGRPLRVHRSRGRLGERAGLTCAVTHLDTLHGVGLRDLVARAPVGPLDVDVEDVRGGVLHHPQVEEELSIECQVVTELGLVQVGVEELRHRRFDDESDRTGFVERRSGVGALESHRGAVVAHVVEHLLERDEVTVCPRVHHIAIVVESLDRPGVRSAGIRSGCGDVRGERQRRAGRHRARDGRQ